MRYTGIKVSYQISKPIFSPVSMIKTNDRPTEEPHRRQFKASRFDMVNSPVLLITLQSNTKPSDLFT